MTKQFGFKVGDRVQVKGDSMPNASPFLRDKYRGIGGTIIKITPSCFYSYDVEFPSLGRSFPFSDDELERR